MAFAPLPFGEISAPDGAIAAVPVDSDGKLWCVSRRLIYELSAVYRKRPDDEEPVLVNPQTVEQEGPDGHQWKFISFPGGQPTGTAITFDCIGIVDGAGEPITAPGEVIKFYFEMHFGALLMDFFNFARFAELKEKTDALEYFADGALVEEITFGESVGRVARSFNIDVFTDRRGRYAADLMVDRDPDAPHFDDTFLLGLDTVSQTIAERHFNAVRFFFERDFARRSWLAELTHKNDADVAAVGKEIEEEINLWWVRDPVMAVKVISDRLSYFDLDAHRITFETPLPATFARLELARQIDISHYAGTIEGGYVREAFKVIGLREDLNRQVTTVDAIRRIFPPKVATPLNLRLSRNSRPGPHIGSSPQIQFGVFRKGEGTIPQTQLAVIGTTNFGQTWPELALETFSSRVWSYDSFATGGFIHVAVQQGGGRVSYWKWSMADREWEIADEEVQGAVDCFELVSIEARSSTEPLIFAGSAAEMVEGVSYKRRSLFRRKADGSWEQHVIGTGTEFHIENGRVVVDSKKRAHLFYWLNTEPGTLRTREQHLVFSTNNTLGPAGEWLQYLLASAPGPSASNYGHPVPVIDEIGTEWVLLPFAASGNQPYTVFLNAGSAPGNWRDRTAMMGQHVEFAQTSTGTPSISLQFLEDVMWGGVSQRNPASEFVLTLPNYDVAGPGVNNWSGKALLSGGTVGPFGSAQAISLKILRIGGQRYFAKFSILPAGNPILYEFVPESKIPRTD